MQNLEQDGGHEVGSLARSRQLSRPSPAHQETNSCTAATPGLLLADLPIGEPVPYCKGSLGEGLDLHVALIPNPACTFYMRVSGLGAWLAVDRNCR